MAEHARSASAKRAANLTIDADLLAEARHFDINISRAAEAGIARAVSDAKAARWKKENSEALQSSNAFVDANGLPLAQFRQF
ncbi:MULTISPECIES: type II toxin-antitoxin system CcdA family antitoxin [Ensifer]|jgi:antitoxin CcdA|uniref:Post-segregation antitoxin CcdA n=1 Tax=Ensifer canadensis TaxID=555315 RepID=A0AAW4FQD4_9HYPH|nr:MULTISPECIES: type II toxin-antitoxin system CcdA family antitoxin [Ensifer]MDP9633093.1 antitoxin CcdA [Ensifer adhaerens]KQU94637.1 post-segregation antitoxin CcdA [Ensifer sp. Root31]KQW61363.1 post-segregation antitoxin CcdA [Ensifer sp. Root1252]KQW82830.1 post-segregation antitoxin CcdA [Ensifer sp. Root127]KQY75015.1 post-segregation antitoxin CcdA [Ensifer sp. Root142]